MTPGVWPYSSVPTHWKTRDGRVIPIKELSDTHLANIKTMLEKRLDRLPSCRASREFYNDFETVQRINNARDRLDDQYLAIITEWNLRTVDSKPCGHSHRMHPVQGLSGSFDDYDNDTYP